MRGKFLTSSRVEYACVERLEKWVYLESSSAVQKAAPPFYPPLYIAPAETKEESREDGT